MVQHLEEFLVGFFPSLHMCVCVSMFHDKLIFDDFGANTIKSVRYLFFGRDCIGISKYFH